MFYSSEELLSVQVLCLKAAEAGSGQLKQKNVWDWEATLRAEEKPED